MSQETRHLLLSDAVRLLRMQGTSLEYLNQLNHVAVGLGIYNTELRDLLKDFHAPDDPEEALDTEASAPVDESKQLWDQVFDGSDLLSPNGLTKSYQKAQATAFPSPHSLRHTFWVQLIVRFDEEKIWTLVETFWQLDFIKYYEATQFLKELPNAWKQKISVQRRWPEVIKQFGYNYAYDMIEWYSFQSAVKNLAITDDLLPSLKEGIISRLADSTDHNEATVFFGFVDLAADILNRDEAIELLDFSLRRLELHIEPDAGDGPWLPWLHPNSSTNKNIASFIWAMLGAPSTAVRWRAAHTIRDLCQFDCHQILSHLVAIAEDDTVRAFIGVNFPFYSLHARLYLFIALDRASVDWPHRITFFNTLLAKFVLEPHALIQYYAKRIITRVESSLSGSFSSELLREISLIGAIRHPETTITTSEEASETKYSETDEEDKLDYHFSWDFEQYWYSPLGTRFNISSKKVQRLAAKVIVEDWGVGKDAWGYKNDPRHVLWDKLREHDNWHSHGDYPRVDDLSFYRCYHAMFVVAARLLTTIPAVSDEDRFSSWEGWLSLHITTLTKDSSWLSDLRDAVPILRPQSILQQHGKDWEDEVGINDFLNCLVSSSNGEVILNIKGWWHEIKDRRKESYSVAISLVDKEASDSLLRAVTTCEDRHDCYLPQYDNHDAQIDSAPFILKGLFVHEYDSKGIDKMDPLANDIAYPPFIIGQTVADVLSISADESGRVWSNVQTGELVMRSESWNSDKNSRDEEPEQSGHRMQATLKGLIELCKATNYVLILQVEIERGFVPYRSQGDRKYKEAFRKFFILNADGKLRDTERYYKLG